MKLFPASFCLVAAWTATLVAALPAVTAAADAGEPRIVDVRVGKHPGYDRLVLELDRDAQVQRRQNPDEEELDVRVGASPALRLHVPDTPQDRMGVVVIEATPQGARVTATPRPRRIRAFRLAKPSRVVVDFADPRQPELPMPADAIPIAMTAEAPPPAEPEPAPEPEEPLPHVGEAPPQAPEEPPAAQVTPLPEPETPSGTPTAVPTQPPQLEPPPTPARPTPALPGSGEEEPLPGESLLPKKEPKTEPAREVASEGSLRSFVVPFLLGSTVSALVALWLVLARSSREARQAAPTPPPPEVLFEAATRIDLLEKRMDEEVRVRMQFEERVSGLHEDLKVIRDRLNRLNR